MKHKIAISIEQTDSTTRATVSRRTEHTIDMDGRDQGNAIFDALTQAMNHTSQADGPIAHIYIYPEQTEN